LASKNRPKPSPPAPAAAPPVAILTGGGFGRDLANGLFPAFLVMILIGFFCIWKFGSPPGNPNPVRALFIAMNAATLSGFNPNPGVGDLTGFGQWVALLLMICGSLFAMIVGGLAVIRIVRLPFSDRELIFSAFVVEGVALLVGTSLLWDPGHSPFRAFFLAASSFGNCGLHVANFPDVLEIPVHAVILPLTFLGGLGLPVLLELWYVLVFRAEISNYSKTIIVSSACIYISALVLLTFLSTPAHEGISWAAIHSQLPVASVLAIESRTGGISIVSPSDLTQAARWVVIGLMMIGASPAGTGGGLKITTFIELFYGTRKLLRGEYPGRSFAIAFVWIAVYLILTLAAVLLLAYVSGSDAGDNIFFNAISAMSNVGFTISPLLDEKGLYFAYSAIILVGRMAPLMILWWMAETTTDAKLAVG
jgi:trk system potassium uptake protein TrkH